MSDDTPQTSDDQELVIALDPFRLTVADLLDYAALEADDEILAWVVAHACPADMEPAAFEGLLLDTNFFEYAEALQQALAQARGVGTLASAGITLDLTLDPDALKLRHMMAARAAQSLQDLIAWTDQHTATTRETFLALPLAVLNDVETCLHAEIKRARTLPKATRQRS